MKFRVGIAAAALVGGGAVAVAAVAATSHGPAAVAQSAGYSSHNHQYGGGAWNQLNTAMNNWNWSQQNSYNWLAATNQRMFMQTTQHGKTFAEQRGIVVLATKKFLILQSANGSLHLWLLSGNTAFQNVSNTTMGTQALTVNNTATWQAMNGGNMAPAAGWLAGSPQTAAMLVAPTRATQTVTVQVAGTNLTVTVIVTQNTATVSQTATMPQNGNPWWQPTTWRQNPWTTAGMGANQLARGDLALVVGFRQHNLLHAKLVLFTPLTTGTIGGTTGGTPAVRPTANVTVAPTGGVATSTNGSSGTHT